MISQGVAMVTVQKVTDIIVPFMPPDDDVDIPELEMETNEGSTEMKPLWQLMAEEAEVKRKASADHHSAKKK
jgi:rare lipoprotein A